MRITEDKDQEIKKDDNNSPYLIGLVVEVETKWVNTYKVPSTVLGKWGHYYYWSSNLNKHTAGKWPKLLTLGAGFHPTRGQGEGTKTVIASSLSVAEWSSMDAVSQVPVEVVLPKHILDIWVIVLIILATIVIMTSLLLCPATAVIIYRMRTHPVLNGAVWEPPRRGRWGMRTASPSHASSPFSERQQEGLWCVDSGAWYARGDLSSDFDSATGQLCGQGT